MNDTRKHGRFDTQLKAQYSLKEKSGEVRDCTVINMSRKGIGIKFHAHQKISIGSSIRLEVFIPEKMKPASILGVLRWIEEKGDDSIAGIECAEILDEMKFSKAV